MDLQSRGPFMPSQHWLKKSAIPRPPQQEVSEGFSANLLSLFFACSCSIASAPFYSCRRSPKTKGYTCSFKFSGFYVKGDVITLLAVEIVTVLDLIPYRADCCRDENRPRNSSKSGSRPGSHPDSS